MPNSVRVVQIDADTSALEFLPVSAGGRYRAAPDASGGGDILDIDSSTDNSFDVLGPAVSVSAGDRLVVYNLTDTDAYNGTSSRVLTSSGSALSALRPRNFPNICLTESLANGLRPRASGFNPRLGSYPAGRDRSSDLSSCPS